jgi:hypothetical protein
VNTEDIDISRFNEIDGTTLCKMSEADFVSREPHYGRNLFSLIQQLKQEQHQQVDYDLNKREFFSSVLYVKVV